MLLEAVQPFGGFKNEHAHIDRADTLDDAYLRHINTTPLEASSLPLAVKQNLTGDLHLGLAYTEKDLRTRMTALITRLIKYGTASLTSCIDVTPDIGENGLLAFRVAMELKDRFSRQIKILLGPNPIFGFKEGTARWDVFAKAAELADFLSALPEKDYYATEAGKDGKIGFRKHLKLVFDLACALGKEVHIHLDQANDPTEVGTEILVQDLQLVQGLRTFEQPRIPGHSGPTVWVVHMISPSGYPEDRFSKLAKALVDLKLGVIVCPTAAISMRQLRPIDAPTHNSIVRLLELIKLGVPIRMGTDNVCDVFVPQSNGDMLTEILMGGHAIRFAPPHVWAKLGAGVPLNQVDRATVGRSLYQDRKVYEGIVSGWQSAVD
jgi:cytosine/adenosine deaminase-related metal-dependent hydrolase